MLFFDCAKSTCVDRCLQRGAAGSGRTDDNRESLEKRFVTYMNDTMAIIEHFRSNGLVREIDAANVVDDVYTEVKSKCAF